ncbi:transporter substrate-binding domain-containing protein [Massilia antarctica]|uniref:transporter substrate-binding domain-containing protein n=1 Tax=Massilia antarctica TaxID=2765360 RepID=UPI00226DE26A|nr:transporter substrate-binding domain-containing protein [Massilia sp. H27-R4]MCY0912405.1 transporter substrate-binding domain-containing protein [Massilia sp. H27-R4]
MNKLAALWLLICLSLAGSACAGNLLAVKQGNRPPFSFRDGQGKATGIEVDVVVEALRRAGRGVTFREAPNVRLLPFVKGDGIDLAVSVRGSDGDGTYFSDEFIRYENVAISRRDRHIVLHAIPDLDRYTFAIWQNGWRDLGPDFQARYRPSADGRFPANYFQPANQNAQNRMFWVGRVDLIIVDKKVFEWYRKQFSAELNTRVELDYHPIFAATTGFQVAFRNREVRDAFNRALHAMRQDHSYDDIVARYGMAQSP